MRHLHMLHRPEERLVTCEACGGDGYYEVERGYDLRDGSPITDERQCEDCAGTGQQVITLTPIEPEDLRSEPFGPYFELESAA